MHDVAEQYYAKASAAMMEFNAKVQTLQGELMAELLSAKVAFDAQWVKRMRDFRGEEAEPEKQEEPSIKIGNVIKDLDSGEVSVVAGFSQSSMELEDSDPLPKAEKPTFLNK